MKKMYTHPNQSVKRILNRYLVCRAKVINHTSGYGRVNRIPGALEDILVGVSWLGATGFPEQPKVIPNKVLSILATQDIISTETVTAHFKGRYKKSMIDNYVAAARVASKAIEDILLNHEEVRFEAETYLLDDQFFGLPEYS